MTAMPALVDALVAASVTLLIVVLAARARRAVVTPRAIRPPRAIERGRAYRGWARPLAMSGTALVGAVTIGPLPTIAAAVLLVLHRRTLPRRVERARRRAIERELPDVMDLLGITIRAGLTPRQAVDVIARATTGSCTGAFAEVVHRTQRGHSFADAVTALPEMLGSGASGVADAIASCERYGLPLEPLLEQLSTEARASRRRLDQADARKLPVRLSFPLVVCTLPSFVLLAIAPAVIAALSSLDAW
jgi:tight adherence protein C